jgi:CheY-like chemotaxis protein
LKGRVMAKLNGARGRVLVVDDDPLITHMVRRILNAYHDVQECNDPREALIGIAHGQRYDVILCDVRMPGCSGEQFLAALRDVSGEQARRLVFVTAMSSIAPGAEFLTMIPPGRRVAKPFYTEDLRRVVDDIVDGRLPGAAEPMGLDAEPKPGDAPHLFLGETVERWTVVPPVPS